MDYGLEDFKHLAKQLQQVADSAGKIVGAGIRAGINVERDGIAAAAPVYPTKSRTSQQSRQVNHRTVLPGGLANSVGAVMVKQSRAHSAEAKAGPGVGKDQAAYGEQVGRGKQSVPYSHLTVLFLPQRFTGQKARLNKKTGRVKVKQTGNPVMNRGEVQFNPWVERGATAVAQQATNAVGETIDKKLKALLKA